MTRGVLSSNNVPTCLIPPPVRTTLCAGRRFSGPQALSPLAPAGGNIVRWDSAECDERRFMNEAFSRLLRRDTKTCAEAWFRRLKRPAERSRQVRTGTTRVQGEYPEGVKAMTDRNEFPDLETAAGLLFDPHIAYIKPTPAAEARRIGI